MRRDGRRIDGRDVGKIENFWFKREGEIQRNGFLPLQTPAELDSLPAPQYGDSARELIYKPGKGFTPVGLADYLGTSGLGYNTVWSIGCPFKCTYCGNTKFIANDASYRKIRHPSARHMVEEVKAVKRTFPWTSTIIFQDDSFLAIPYRELEEFASLWRAEVGLPFVVAGVIPNYVRKDKLQILTWAGLNRIRMGIQSGSQRILDFYKRPTPAAKIEAAAIVNASFAPRHHIPPAYDIIMDNPIETRQDVVDTLEMLYRLARPFTLNIYSLKVIPNTELEQQMREAGVEMEGISAAYMEIPPKWANVLLYLIAIWRPPRWLWARLLKRAEASGTPQKSVPLLALTMRTLYLAKRVAHHIRFMDFSTTIPGWGGWILWRLGIVSFWWKHFSPRPERPQDPGHADEAPVVFAREG